MSIPSISPKTAPQTRHTARRFVAACALSIVLTAEAIAGSQGAMSLQPISTHVPDSSAAVVLVQPGLCLADDTSRDPAPGKADDAACQRPDVRPDMVTGERFLLPRLEPVNLKLSPQLGSRTTVRSERDSDGEPPISPMLSACLALMWIVAWRRFRAD